MDLDGSMDVDTCIWIWMDVDGLSRYIGRILQDRRVMIGSILISLRDSRRGNSRLHGFVAGRIGKFGIGIGFGME